MITKGDIVSTALRKLVGDENSTLTGIEPGSMAAAVDDLESMMAQWQKKGYDLNYNFAESDAVTPIISQNSDLALWVKMIVASNLAVLIAPDFGLEASQTVQNEASRGWTDLIAHFSHPGSFHNTRIIPLGTGNLRDGTIICTGTTDAGDKFK